MGLSVASGEADNLITEFNQIFFQGQNKYDNFNGGKQEKEYLERQFC